MIDLHSHSTCSDGSETPERLVQLAAAAGCRALALTDHDTLEGLPAAGRAAADAGVELINGCEVSCRFQPGSMHLLCYFVDGGEGPLQDQLARLRDDRETRNERLVARLNELGIPVTMSAVAAVAGGGTIGRPHFARVLTEMGAVESYEAAFDTLLTKGAPAYIPKAFIDAPTTIAAAEGSGALVSLAHPFSLGLEPAALESTLRELASAGLTGLECWYGRYTPEERSELASMAERTGLVATGGSDFHGTFKPDLAVGVGIGDLHVPDEALEALKSRLR